MRITKSLCLVIASILFAMLVCPAIAATHENSAKKMDHCSSEKPAPQQKQTMLCCCDQNAVSVLNVHAPYQVPVAHVLTDKSVIPAEILFASHRNYLPYQRTGDLLSKLCVLRF